MILFSGAFYILDGREQELCKNIDVKKPLWGVIDIYGNVKSKYKKKTDLPENIPFYYEKKILENI